MMHICLRQPRQVVQTELTRKVEKKKKRRLWTTDANRLQITVNLKKMRHLRRAFQRFCASSHPSYKCYMLENLAFSTIRLKLLMMLILQIANITAPLRVLWPCFFFLCLRSGTVTTLTISDILMVSWCNPSEGAGIYVCVHLWSQTLKEGGPWTCWWTKPLRAKQFFSPVKNAIQKCCSFFKASVV